MILLTLLLVLMKEKLECAEWKSYVLKKVGVPLVQHLRPPAYKPVSSKLPNGNITRTERDWLGGIYLARQWAYFEKDILPFHIYLF